MSDAYRLTFLLPKSMLLLVPEGRHQPCLMGCLLTVRSGLVTVDGTSRDRVFDQVRRFFRAHARRLPALQVAATLETPRGAPGGIPPGRDGYTIILNSDVTITPATIEANIDRAPPLTIISAG